MSCLISSLLVPAALPGNLSLSALPEFSVFGCFTVYGSWAAASAAVWALSEKDLASRAVARSASWAVSLTNGGRLNWQNVLRAAGRQRACIKRQSQQ